MKNIRQDKCKRKSEINNNIIYKDNRSTWKARFNLLLIAVIVVPISEFFGPLTLKIGGVKMSILPMLYALTICILLTPYLLGRHISFLRKFISDKEIRTAAPLIALTLYPLGILFGIFAGPKVGIIIQGGPALILQELGNLATMLIALPIALALGLGRTAWGATYSLGRDTALGITADRYGLNSPEGMGTLGTYIVGSVVGTIYFSLLAPLGLGLGLHPFALAMASGMGSASMMGAATASLASCVPANMQEYVYAYSATSGLLTGVTGVYVELFVAFPLANYYYRKMHPFFAKLNPKGSEVPSRHEEYLGDLDHTATIGKKDTHFAVTLDQLKFIILVYIILFIGQTVGYHTKANDLFPALCVSFVIVVMAVFIKNFVRRPNLPGFAWAALIAFILTLPVSPVQDFIISRAGHINFSATVTPLLVFAGISIGDKIPLMKKLSWKLVLVALIVMASTYFISALISQTVLSYQGMI